MPKSPSNQIFDKTSFLHGANATYVEEMFKKYSDDPSSVPNDWGIFLKILKMKGSIQVHTVPIGQKMILKSKMVTLFRPWIVIGQVCQKK